MAASLFYSLAVVYIPAIIGGLDPVAMQESYFPLIGLNRVFVVLVVNLLAAVLMALFGRR